jgi:hypothetical protein
MLASRMLALLPLLMMDLLTRTGKRGGTVRTFARPRRRSKKTPVQVDAGAFAAWEVVEEGAHGAAAPTSIYDVEMDNILEGRAEAGLYAPKASIAGARARAEELNPNVKETRRKYTLATKMHYIELAEIAQRDEGKDSL